jgi:hypothetical protein
VENDVAIAVNSLEMPCRILIDLAKVVLSRRERVWKLARHSNGPCWEHARVSTDESDVTTLEFWISDYPLSAAANQASFQHIRACFDNETMPTLP